ncbi:MAG: hypothetical protein A2W19_06820 [Spirochaetes bacterium RBG_16_49_21]|nr:MAG: hypothetical protein A2W19_06820 [Spirochaetes bacterium RBG_16_49_21]
MKTLSDKLFEALKGEMTPKFLATSDGSIPNVVPVISIEPYDHRTLIFGDFLMWKTEKNLNRYTKVTVAVITEKLHGAVIRGEFLGFQKTGEYVDRINATKNFRYNAYTGIRCAGSIAVTDITDPFQLTPLDVLSGNLLSMIGKGRAMRFSEGRSVMNRVVAEKYGRLKAVKVLSFMDPRGYPFAVPIMSIQPAAGDLLIFRKSPMTRYLGDLRDGAAAAVSVITFDPVAFQVKGVYRNIDKKYGAVAVSEAYHASPPLPGRKIA